MKTYYQCIFTLLLIFQQGCDSRDKPSLEKEIIILITVDSLRTDHIGCYGYPKNTTPNIDKLSKNAYKFNQAYATSTWTKPSIASLLTSRYMSEHLVVIPVNKEIAPIVNLLDPEILARGISLPERFPLFHEFLINYEKAAYINNPHLHAQFGFNRGWDVYEYFDPKITNDGVIFSRAGEMNREALKFIDQSRSQKLFIWMHYDDVHEPYGPSAKYLAEFYPDIKNPELIDNIKQYSKTLYKANKDPKKRHLLVALYDSGLKQFDQYFGKFINELKKRNLYENALIVFTSDHGEEFFEHGCFGHGKNLFNITSSVPLLLKLPRQKEAGSIDRVVSLVDIGPTVLDKNDLEIPKYFKGKSLLPLIRGENQGKRYAILELENNRMESHRAIVYEGNKLIISLKNGLSDWNRADRRLYSMKDYQERKPLREFNDPQTGKTIGKLEDLLLSSLKSFDFKYHFKNDEDVIQGNLRPVETKNKILKELRALGYL